MYIRFVVGTDDEDHRWLTGVVTEARFLIERGELQTYEIEWLEETFSWFNENVSCPPFSTDNRLWEGACWFKPNAKEAIAKVWEIVTLLKEHDVPVRMLRSSMPGRCLYEDEFQIVVVERKKL